jgi:hypothetical protein
MCPASSIAHQPYGVVARPAGSTCCTALCSSTAHLGRARVVVMCCLRPPFPSTIAVGVENRAHAGYALYIPNLQYWDGCPAEPQQLLFSTRMDFLFADTML